MTIAHGHSQAGHDRHKLIQVSPSGRQTCCNGRMFGLPSRTVTRQNGTTAMLEHDLRGLPSPLPFERALELVEQLAPGQVVCVLTPFHPLPLLDLLAARGYDVRTSVLADGGTRVEVGCMLAHDPTRD
jgi:hypothetical protein